MEDLSWRTDEALGHPTRLQTGSFHLPVEHDWGDGQMFIRQPYPLPATILALTTKIEEDSD